MSISIPNASHKSAPIIRCSNRTPQDLSMDLQRGLDQIVAEAWGELWLCSLVLAMPRLTYAASGTRVPPGKCVRAGTLVRASIAIGSLVRSVPVYSKLLNRRST
jgi:hypothetical protein